MRLKKGLYVELHWLLRQLSGVEASQLSCAELMSSPVEVEEEDDLLTAVEEEPTPVRRMSTVAETKAPRQRTAKAHGRRVRAAARRERAQGCDG